MHRFIIVAFAGLILAACMSETKEVQVTPDSKPVKEATKNVEKETAKKEEAPTNQDAPTQMPKVVYYTISEN